MLIIRELIINFGNIPPSLLNTGKLRVVITYNILLFYILRGMETIVNENKHNFFLLYAYRSIVYYTKY